MQLSTTIYEKKGHIAYVTLNRPEKLNAMDDIMHRELAEKLARRFCELSPVAAQGMKESMVRASTLDYAAVDHITDWLQTRVMSSADRQEGARAFIKKRQAVWEDE